jgi:hypothetical protein
MANKQNNGSGKQRRMTKKGIILTAAIVTGIILASFVVYFIP